MKDRPACHQTHDLYSKNRGITNTQPILPLPPQKGLHFKINYYGDVPEPKFDPDIHLNFGYPDYVRIFPNFEKVKNTPPFLNSPEGSKFAYSAPFQLLSEEGIRVLTEIAYREQHMSESPKTARGNKLALRGLWYLSPFVRDLQSCPRVRAHFAKIAGEELIPHPSYCNSPQVNFSVEGAVGAVDVWHYDSIAYTGVVLLSDVRKMEGGKLEIIHHNKHEGLERVASGQNYESGIVGYEQPGKMILAQGSEILHHVTPVTNSATRISLIFGFAPANSFQPPKTILQTMVLVDSSMRMARYEYSHEKAWQGMNCLKYYVDEVKYSNDGKMLGEKLRALADELKRAADILEEKDEDTIKVFDEKNGKIVVDYGNLASIS